MPRNTSSAFVDQLYRQLPVLYRAILHHEENALASGALSLPQSWALEALERGPLAMRNLCTLLRMKHSTGTAFVDRLEDMNYVRRKRLPDDRRSVTVELTSVGRKATRSLRAKKRRGMMQLFKPFNARERAAYLQLIAKLVAHVSQGVRNP